MNVIKAEHLPVVKNGKCNSFVSVRCIGTVQRSKIITDNFNPLYNSKVMFPVYTPILNDKIVVRVWSQGEGLNADKFIGSVPELPSKSDFFNIMKLM